MPLRVVVTRTQLTKLACERNQGKTLSMSAMKAGISRNTARKYLRQNDMTEQRREPHGQTAEEAPRIDLPHAPSDAGTSEEEPAPAENTMNAPATPATAPGSIRLHPAPESPPAPALQARADGQTPPTPALAIRGGNAHAGAFEEILPELYPPHALLSLPWRDAALHHNGDAALHHNGGAVLLMDGTIAIWDVSKPGKEHRFTLGSPADALAATPVEAVARSRDGSVWLLPRQAGAQPRPLAGKGISRLHASAQPGRMLAAAASGFDKTTVSLMILPFAEGANPVPLPASGAFSALDDAALASDGHVWALSKQSHAYLWRPGSSAYVQAAEARFLSLAAFGSHVAVVRSGTGELSLLNGSGGSPAVAGMARVIGVNGMALAWGRKGKAVLWGSRVTGSPRHFQLPKDHTEVRLGPTGLFVSW